MTDLPLEGTPEFIARYGGDIDDTGYPPKLVLYVLDLLKRPSLMAVPPLPENLIFLEDYRHNGNSAA